MKVLFSHSYYYPLDEKQWKKKQPYPPLGTIQAASWIRQHEHEVSLFDTNLIDNPKLIEPELKGIDLLVIYDDGFNYLTKMCLTNMREAAFEMTKLAKNHGELFCNCVSKVLHFALAGLYSGDIYAHGRSSHTFIGALTINNHSTKKAPGHGVARNTGNLYVYNNRYS